MGTSALMWSDAFFASGAVINFNNGNMTITNAAGSLNIAGGNLGLGVTPTRQFHVYGAGQATGNITDAGNKGGTIYIQDSTNSVDSGGAILFGAFSGNFASIKGLLTNGGTNTTGDLTFSTRAAVFDTNLTERMRITGNGHIATLGLAPAVTSCGTSPSITATATDNAGKVTIGTGSTTSCTVTFALAYATAPACTVTGDDTAYDYAATTSTTVLTITSSASMASDVIMYGCLETI